jgi:hypothetical protein
LINTIAFPVSFSPLIHVDPHSLWTHASGTRRATTRRWMIRLLHLTG